MQRGKKLVFGVLPAMLCIVVLMLSACGGAAGDNWEDISITQRQ